MADKTTEQKAIEIAKLLIDGKGRNVTLIDVSGLNSWTDYFVISTVTSSTQTQGLYKQVKDYIKENDLEIHLTKRKSSDGDDWNLIVVIPVSVHTGRGMKDAQHQIMELVSKQEKRDQQKDAAAKQESSGANSNSHFMNSAYIDDDDENIQYPGSEE